MSKNIGRLQEVLNQINDPKLKEIVEGVFKVEISYRSMERDRFPRQKIKDVVDSVARTIETKTKQANLYEAAKD
jgi:hypothetical protein